MGSWFIGVKTISAGLLAATAMLVSAPASAMTFTLAPVGNPQQCGARCPKIIIAEGEIGVDTPERFLAFLRQNIRDRSVRAVVLMNSPGGVVTSSMRLGTLFRQAGTAVVVARVGGITPAGQPVFAAANCASACVYALIGAKKRVVPPQSRLVLHRMFAYETFGTANGLERQKTYRNSHLYNQLSRYARSMGVNPEVIRQAESVPPEKVRVVTAAEIRRWRLADQKF